MRYLAQPTETDCGPTVAVNALKWAGVKATREKTLPKARKGMRWVPDNGGCYNTHIFETIGKMGKGVITLRRGAVTTASAMNHIDNGGAAAVTLICWEGVQHICLVVKGDSGWLPYKIINGHMISTVPTEHGITRRSFKRILRKKSTDAFLISKV
jgi:hypothetical protein